MKHLKIIKFLYISLLFVVLSTLNLHAWGLGNKLTSIAGPSTVKQGETVNITVKYTATANRDIYIVLHYNHSPWTSFASGRVTVHRGSGTVTVPISVPSDMEVGNDYSFLVILTKVGKSWGDRDDYKEINPVDVIAKDGSPASNEIISISGPSTVKQGETVNIPVEYTATADRDIYITLQYNHSPWTTFADKRVTVHRGSGTVTLPITVPSDIDIGNDYLFQVLLTKVGKGWGDRDDAKWINPVDVIKNTALDCTVETADNLITNACVEPKSSPWRHYGNDTQWVDDEGHSGTHSLKVENRAKQNAGWHYPTITIDHKKTITFGGWNKAKNVSSDALNTLDFKVTFSDGSYKWFVPGALRFSKGTHEWEHRELTETFDKEVVSIKPYVLLYYGTGTAWFDDIYVIPALSSSNIISISGPSTVKQGETVTISIDYNAAEKKDIYVEFQLDHDPYTSFVTNRVTVDSGTGTVNIPITIPADTDTDEVYRFTGVLTEVSKGWSDRDDAKWIRPVKVTADDDDDDDLPSTCSAKAIKKNVRFTWMDGVAYNNTGWGPHNHKAARIKTITFYDDSIGADRVIDFEHNLQVDFDYELSTDFSIHSNDKKLYVSHPAAGTGQEYTTMSRNDVQYNTYRYRQWVSKARNAFSDSDLNYYVGGDAGGSQTEVRGSGIPGRGTVIHKLTYPTPFKISNSIGGGYVFVTERGGNNSQFVVARDEDGKILGSVCVRQAADGAPNCSQDVDNSDVSYVNTGNTNDNGQEICMAIYPLQALASPGKSIASIELLAVDSDAGGRKPEGSYNGDAADGKIFLVHELAAPDVCYDYSVRQGGHTLTSEDRKFTALGNEKISIAMGLRSMEADYDMTQSKASITAPGLTFDKAEYAPNNVNTLVDAIYIHAPSSPDFNSSRPEIAIGNNPQSGANGGGIIKANERYFSKYTYNSSSGDKTFDIDLNITVDISEEQNNPITYLLTSDPAKYNAPNSIYRELKRCEQSKVYNPEWGTFNVERTDSATSEEKRRFSLYTQTVGKDFDFSVVAYGADSSYQTPSAISNTTLEVELIDVSSYDDNGSLFACADPNPEIIQKLGSGNSKFVHFGDDEERVDITDNDDLITDRALRNAAFRVWSLLDKEGTTLHHNCTDPSDNTCFQKLYDDNLSASDTQGFCSDCSSYENEERKASGCYACLRDYFGKASCSRDNFSIRPASYRLALSDSNESKDSKTPAISLGTNDSDSSDTAPVASISAGYKYKLEGNATSFAGDKVLAKGYRQLFGNEDIANLLSVLNFKDEAPSCYDKNSTYWQVFFDDAQIVGVPQANTLAIGKGNLVKHSNVGTYAYHLHDSNWTIVDQKRYKYKTFPEVDDCLPGDSSIAANSNERSGCDIDSKLTTDNATYNDLYLRYQPYAFDLSDINFSTSPVDQDILFMTDFDDPYYGTTASLSETMAAIHEGNITAHGKDGILTTNFTDGCAASDLTIVLNRETNDTEANLETLYDIKMQQYLQYGNNLDLKTTFDDNQTGKDVNLTLAKAAFEDDATPGSARVRIYTTFKKPMKKDLPAGAEGIDPIEVNYLETNASSIDANSTAHMSSHIPRGAKNLDQNITFVYARVVPKKKLYIEKERNWKKTPLYVNIYCGHGAVVCGERYDLNTSSLAEEISSTWYQASKLFSPNKLGTSDLNISHYTGRPSNPRLSYENQNEQEKITKMGYSSDTAAQEDLNVSIQPNDPRPTTVRIKYKSSPWLRYPGPGAGGGGAGADEDEDNPFDVRFPVGPGMWTGHGKTGYVVDDEISDSKSRRVEW